MKFPSIRNYDFSGKVVLLRVDINSPVKNGKVMMNERIEQAAKTINTVMKKKAKVVVLAHQGRKGKDDFVSLKKHSKFLKKFVKIGFVDDIIGERAENKIKKLRDGEAILLENVRFLDEEMEEKNYRKNKFVQKMKEWGDFYINDAFSVCHRKQASVYGIPQFLDCCFGPLIVKELESLEKIKIKNVLYVLGGAKAEENMLFLQKDKKILGVGMFGQLCMLAKGFNFGKHEEFLEKKNLNKLKRKIKNLKIELPEDFAVDDRGRKELELNDFPNEYEIFDLGEKSIKKFVKKIEKAKAVFMKGPAGYIEDKRFRKGTEKILKAVARAKFSVIGGGHLSTAIQELKISKKRFNHISLSGGALANYVAGKKLPGVEIVMKK